MDYLKIGRNFKIQCYKQNGKINGEWSEAILLEKHDKYLVFGNDKTVVKEVDGSIWQTKEPAIIYFFKDEWFNIIVQLKKKGIYYYCNIASPFIIEDGTIKYIDYDLDLRIFSNGHFKILDKNEYVVNSVNMKYSHDLKKSINLGLDRLIKLYKEKSLYFDSKNNYILYKKYKKLKKLKKGVDLVKI